MRLPKLPSPSPAVVVNTSSSFRDANSPPPSTFSTRNKHHQLPRNQSMSYKEALTFARRPLSTDDPNYLAAQEAFRRTTSLYPNLVKAWVSWAQMEKRVTNCNTNNSNFKNAIYEEASSSAVATTANSTNTGRGRVEKWQRCREILQKALTVNPNDPWLCQAWGLLELQKGHWFAAVVLLERCVRADPGHFSPLLKWQIVQQAKQKTIHGSTRRGRK